MSGPYKPVLGSDIFPRKQGNIMGVDITGTSSKRLLIKISEYFQKSESFKTNLASNRPLFVTTPNPEHAVLAYEDPRFKEILQRSGISLCDGVGLLAAYEYLKRMEIGKRPRNIKDGHPNYLSEPEALMSRRPNHPKHFLAKFLLFIKSSLYILKNGKSSDGLKVIKGRNFMIDLLKIANDKKYKVFLLGSTKKILIRAVNRLSKKYPAVRFKTYHGAKLDSNSVPLTDKETRLDRKSLRMINRFAPQMLFVAYGAPKQEKWVYRNIDQLKTGLVMVVGGSFDYIAGTRKAVPQLLNSIGLEWLWRLLTGSQNLKRVYNAVIKFPFLVLKES